jgi:hypothetical protein
MFHSFPTPWSTSFVRRADDKPAAHFLHCLCISPEVARRRFFELVFLYVYKSFASANESLTFIQLLEASVLETGDRIARGRHVGSRRFLLEYRVLESY